MWTLRYEFAVMFVMFIWISYFASHDLTRETFLVSREQKLKKLVYFLATMMNESSIFSINMIVHVNLVVNSALF